MASGIRLSDSDLIDPPEFYAPSYNPSRETGVITRQLRDQMIRDQVMEGYTISPLSSISPPLRPEDPIPPLERVERPETITRVSTSDPWANAIPIMATPPRWHREMIMDTEVSRNPYYNRPAFVNKEEPALAISKLKEYLTKNLSIKTKVNQAGTAVQVETSLFLEDVLISTDSDDIDIEVLNE